MGRIAALQVALSKGGPVPAVYIDAQQEEGDQPVLVAPEPGDTVCRRHALRRNLIRKRWLARPPAAEVIAAYKTAQAAAGPICYCSPPGAGRARPDLGRACRGHTPGMATRLRREMTMLASSICERALPDTPPGLDAAWKYRRSR